jgi:hypothetical protein
MDVARLIHCFEETPCTTTQDLLYRKLERLGHVPLLPDDIYKRLGNPKNWKGSLHPYSDYNYRMQTDGGVEYFVLKGFGTQFVTSCSLTLHFTSLRGLAATRESLYTVVSSPNALSSHKRLKRLRKRFAGEAARHWRDYGQHRLKTQRIYNYIDSLEQE